VARERKACCSDRRALRCDQIRVSRTGFFLHSPS
jgi:hypothetical protein